MTSDEQHLDGNAAGGVLGQIFAFEMTTAEVICAHCDTVSPIGEAMVYATAMGTIVLGRFQRHAPAAACGH